MKVLLKSIFVFFICLTLVFSYTKSASAACRFGTTPFACYTRRTNEISGCVFNETTSSGCAWTQVEAATFCSATPPFRQMWWNTSEAPKNQECPKRPTPPTQPPQQTTPVQTNRPKPSWLFPVPPS